MPNLKEIIKVTREQMTTLRGGGAISGHTLSDDVLYAVEAREYYDTVISNQAEFENWYAELDAGTYNSESVLILSGEYTRSDGRGLHLPGTLRQLRGLGNVVINITNFAYNNISNKGGIWYLGVPNKKEGSSSPSIENILLNVTSIASHPQGFQSCMNLINCTVNLTTKYGGWGFTDCFNLTNCSCTANSSSSGTLVGFGRCTNLNECVSNVKTVDGRAVGFAACNNMVNCTGSGIGTTNSFSFSSCNTCSNCSQIEGLSSTTGVWDGGTNVDPDTCPEYSLGKLYRHSILFKGTVYAAKPTVDLIFTCSIVSERADEYDVTSLADFLYTNGYSTLRNPYAVNGSVLTPSRVSGTSTIHMDNVVAIYSDNSTDLMFIELQQSSEEADGITNYVHNITNYFSCWDTVSEFQ